MAQGHKASWTPERRAAQAERMRQRMANPEVVKKMVAKRKRSAKKVAPKKRNWRKGFKAMIQASRSPKVRAKAVATLKARRAARAQHIDIDAIPGERPTPGAAGASRANVTRGRVEFAMYTVKLVDRLSKQPTNFKSKLATDVILFARQALSVTAK